jgi:hypothetical protein
MPPKRRSKGASHQASRLPPSLIGLEVIPLEVFEMIVKEINIFDLPNFLRVSKTTKVAMLGWRR